MAGHLYPAVHPTGQFIHGSLSSENVGLSLSCCSWTPGPCVLWGRIGTSHHLQVWEHEAQPLSFQQKSNLPSGAPLGRAGALPGVAPASSSCPVPAPWVLCLINHLHTRPCLLLQNCLRQRGSLGCVLGTICKQHGKCVSRAPCVTGLCLGSSSADAGGLAAGAVAWPALPGRVPPGLS